MYLCGYFVWCLQVFKKGIVGVICVETTIKYFVASDCTFQLTQGNSIANKKTPSSGPLVADVISIDDSITPDSVATPNEIPMMRTP